MLQKGERISFERRGDRMIVHIRGEIDHHSAVLVRTGIDREIMQDRPREVLLDLSGVDFMDSSGLGLIMGRYALVTKYGGTLAVVDPSFAVTKILRLAGMERMITIKRTKEKKV